MCCLQWQWITPLKDLTVKETEEALFECELSVPNVITTWKVKGEVVEQSPKYVIKSEKSKHTLIVSKCRPRDQGDVSCTYSDLTTEATLTVKGLYYTLPL